MASYRRAVTFAAALVGLLCTLGDPGSAQVAQPSAVPSPVPSAFAAIPRVELRWGLKIPMRDGVELNATLYRPSGQARLPVLVTQTPYTTDEYHDRAMTYARRGYAVVVVDVRGRGNSGGEFSYYLSSANDGNDLVEWLAKQPWSTGKVATWGGSYAGANQWLTASQVPEGLATMTPRAAAYLGLDVPMVGGIPYTQRLPWLASIAGRTRNESLSGDRLFWGQILATHTAAHRAYRQLDSYAGMPSALFQTWVAHTEIDDYYKSMRPTAEQYAALDLPILSITGYFDGSQRGTLEHYRQSMANAAPSARSKHFLIMGPWDHGGTGRPRTQVGGLTLPAASAIDMDDLLVKWFDWTLKGGGRPALLRDQVTYFTLGPDEWRHAASFDAIGAKPRSYRLSSTSGRLSFAAPGELALADVAARGVARARYVYNPMDVAGALARDTSPNPATYRDNRLAESIDGNGLIYLTEPFQAATELTGFPKVVLYAAMDVPDTDFAVSLYELDSAGKPTLLGFDMLRARYRKSLEKAELVQPGRVERYEFKGLPFFSRVIPAGHRIRLVVSAPNSMLVQRNYNSGGVVADETGKDARIANIEVFQTKRYQSVVELPVVVPAARPVR